MKLQNEIKRAITELREKLKIQTTMLKKTLMKEQSRIN